MSDRRKAQLSFIAVLLLIALFYLVMMQEAPVCNPNEQLC